MDGWTGIGKVGRGGEGGWGKGGKIEGGNERIKEDEKSVWCLSIYLSIHYCSFEPREILQLFLTNKIHTYMHTQPPPQTPSILCTTTAVAAPPPLQIAATPY